MAVGRFSNGELSDPWADGEPIPTEEAAAEKTFEDLPIEALLMRVDAALEGPRYEVRTDSDGWQIADLHTGFVAKVNGFVLARLSLQRANSLADVLNRFDLRERHLNRSR